MFPGALPAVPAALLALAAGGPLASLVEAERAFARLSAERGIKAAFLENLDQGAIVFRPEPADARAFYARRPDPAAVLEWEPAFAAVARSGDFGYTTGPWSLRPKSGSPDSPAFGHYVSVWTRRGGGPWRVAIDCGVPHPEAPKPARVATPRGAADPRPGSRIEELLDLDRRFSPDMAAADLRVYRPGIFPLTGAAAMEALRKSSSAGDARGGRIASSGDLGFTYGVAAAPQGPASCLRIWRRQAGRWAVVLELLNPLKPGAAP